MNRRVILIGAGALAAIGGGESYALMRHMGSMTDYDAAMAIGRETLSSRPAIPEIIRMATLAPSGHNTQPWHFRIGRTRIEILPDLSRKTPVADPDDHHLSVALGCAAQNLVLAVGTCGH